MEIYRVEDFNFDSLEFKPAQRRNGETGTIVYADCVTSFDIETTRLEEFEQSIMYIWQFAIEETVIYGRTWYDFEMFLKLLKRRLNGMHLVCYVHNLSYEFQFLSGVHHFGKWDVFCTEPRKILKAEMMGFLELRCSYKLTNLSLAAMSARYNKKYLKQSGEDFDYSKRRFYDTELSETELKYAAYDVLAVNESIHKIMELNDENLYSIPLTSTGFVRKSVRQAMAPYYFKMRDLYPPYRVYQLLKSAFRGGNTHASRFYAGELVRNVSSVDISSSYPSQQCNREFPVTKWEERKDHTHRHFNKLVSRGAAIIMRVVFYDIELRYRYAPVPYIAEDKCISVVFPDDKDGLCRDNGRIIRAKRIEAVITDLDFHIIDRMYKCKDWHIEEMFSSWYGKLPEPIIQKNIEYFRNKTTLKGVEGQELYYMKNKEMLNSIYGMSVQDVVKQRILFNDDGNPEHLYMLDTKESTEEIFKRKQKSAWTQFSYGVWTTCHARMALQHGIDMCGDNLIYVDTDSCKYAGTVNFDDYNKARIKECMESGLYAVDPKGITHYGGVYEYETCYKTFKTLGAKKYCYEDEKGLHITVSGVNKQKGAEELASRGGIDAFEPGFIFYEAGKTESVYNDYPEKKLVQADGHLVPITRNMVIRDVTYTLSLTDDYTSLLNASASCLNKVHKHWLNLQLK